MFRKVLIANRGEIAVRIIRACRDLGISPVAVYSEVDRTSLHVRLADEAYLLGPAPSSESYLVVEKIIDAARKSKADAIHPGYGFLSENPRLAAACADAGIPMVGPSAHSMRIMGSKTGARSILLRSGVQLVPGTYRTLNTAEEAAEEARIIGYPVMLKAAAGGGGKGMRLVESEDQLKHEFQNASSEALGAFGDPSVYLEKYIARPRHVEIQVLADRYGNAVYLGERECSIQRRHQKVLEESPSPLMDEDMRCRMGESAMQVLRAAGYENAGTVEFLVDGDRKFYFLEMNTRLQVEHPVTEAVTGVDIVQEQLRIAAGDPLTLRQEDIRLRGWALECRIYAEDPERNFLPSPGVIGRLIEPQGPGVRVDSGVYQGWEVPIHYDPLVAKLVTYGSDRNQAIARMCRAIHEYRVEGIKTNLEFFADLLRDEEFTVGNLSTNFIEEFLGRRGSGVEKSSELFHAHAIAAALAYGERMRAPQSAKPSSMVSGWRLSTHPGGSAPRQGWKR
ncbi:MAG TPA: acetyl-CoA carboxylase biotin carboxylase subunit [Acidobacteriota bacterium]|nr:acetyl-CoA carboxylase biotin carboxylase subunit [Acidobacteriota bacterium]